VLTTFNTFCILAPSTTLLSASKETAMAYLTQLRNAWLNRQYRMTYRAVINGLLAASHTDDSVIEKAHSLTVQSLARFQKSEISDSSNTN
jgi:hypothetical protein